MGRGDEVRQLKQEEVERRQDVVVEEFDQEPVQEQEPKPVVPITRRRLTSLRQGQAGVFVNRGFAYLKRVGPEGTWVDEIPITTEKLEATLTTYMDKRPKPPTVHALATPDSEIGQAAGITKAQGVIHYDLTNEQYQKDMENWTKKLNWAVAAAAIDIDIEYIDSNNKVVVASGLGERVTGLKQMGMSYPQATEIAAAAQKLWSFSEEEERRFFAVPSA